MPITFDGPRLQQAIRLPGFAYDLIPGASVDDWEFDGTYAWPMPYGASPITLLPAHLAPDWSDPVAAASGSYDSGPYGRWTLDHFNVNEGQFDQLLLLHSKDYVLYSRGMGGSLTSRKSLPGGAGIVFDFAPHGVPLNQFDIFHLEFGGTQAADKYRLAIQENGYGRLYKAPGTPAERMVASGRINSGKSYFEEPWPRVVVLPHGRNRILIGDGKGNGFIHEDRGISRKPYRGQQSQRSIMQSGSGSLSGTPLTKGPPTKLGPVSLTAFTKSAVRINPTKYIPPTGPPIIGAKASVVAVPSVLSAPRYAATTGPSLLRGQFDRPAPLPPDAITLPTPTVELHTNHANVRPKVNFNRRNVTEEDHMASPMLYRVEAAYASVPHDKHDFSFDMTEDLIDQEYARSKDVLSGSAVFRNAENHKTLARSFNIPFQWDENGDVYIFATLLPGTFTVHGGRVQTYHAQLQDITEWWNKAFVYDKTRFDDINLTQAFKDILIAIGFPADGSLFVISDTKVTNDGEHIRKTSVAEASDEATNASDLTKSAADWIDYFITTYTSCRNYPYQWVAGTKAFYDTVSKKMVWKAYILNPDEISTVPVKTWFPDFTTAMKDGIPFNTSYRSVHENWQHTPVMPEANALLVAGMGQSAQGENPAAVAPPGLSIQRYKEDKRSIDPTIPLSERPKNHLGQRYLVVLIDASLNTQNDVDAVANALFPRLSTARLTASFEAQWEPSVQVWDTVRILHPTGSFDYAERPYANNKDLEESMWRVSGFSVHTKVDTSDHYSSRKCTYYLEREYK